jgi:hypothetical protein
LDADGTRSVPCACVVVVRSLPPGRTAPRASDGRVRSARQLPWERVTGFELGGFLEGVAAERTDELVDGDAVGLVPAGLAGVVTPDETAGALGCDIPSAARMEKNPVTLRPASRMRLAW